MTDAAIIGFGIGILCGIAAVLAAGVLLTGRRAPGTPTGTTPAPPEPPELTDDALDRIGRIVEIAVDVARASGMAGKIAATGSALLSYALQHAAPRLQQAGISIDPNELVDLLRAQHARDTGKLTAEANTRDADGDGWGLLPFEA